MNALNENYKNGLKQFIKCQEVLIESIRVDIVRSNEDIRFEELKRKLNKDRLEIEEKSLVLANENLENFELEED